MATQERLHFNLAMEVSTHHGGWQVALTQLAELPGGNSRQLRSQCINDAEMRQDLMQAVHVDDSHGLPYPKVLELQTARTADAQGTDLQFHNNIQRVTYLDFPKCKVGGQQNCFWLSLNRLTTDAYYGFLNGHAGSSVVHQTVLQVYQIGRALFILAVSFFSSERLLSSLSLQSGQDQRRMGRTDGAMGRLDELMGRINGLMGGIAQSNQHYNLISMNATDYRAKTGQSIDKIALLKWSGQP
ncbi:MAG: hypothetical protein FRX49_08482 [Trebouxia sp. A1-2]|nr:MAG: hypothetical protein FRX49_08482 [Trebouxia sp. A1-2]